MTSLDLESFWSWLPTFRVVAERENLQEASRLLRLSASSISRTIRLLETDLGAQLFTRGTGRLLLTPSGRAFLECVRRSMRLVDDGVSGLRSPEISRPFRLSVPRALMSVVAIPTMARTRAAEPTASFYVTHDGDEKAVASGMIDLAVVATRRGAARDVEVHLLGEVALGVYCGREHALWSAPSPSAEDVMRHSFVTASNDALEVAAWPPELRRQVALELGDLAAAQEACVASLGLAALPRAAAREAVANRTLRRLEAPEPRAVRLFALRRPTLRDGDRAHAVVKELERTVQGLGAE